MSTLDDRVVQLEHRVLALEQLLDKLMIYSSPIYHFESATSTWREIGEDEE